MANELPKSEERRLLEVIATHLADVTKELREIKAFLDTIKERVQQISDQSSK
jgi:uncharacterized coiled-coil DUF342 family protein